MKKYWHVIKIGIQNTLVYRFNFFVRSGFSLVPLVATILLWRTIYSQSPGTVSGYTLDGMISYYLLITVVDALTNVNEDDWQIAGDIKDGNISQFLLKPIDYLTYRLCLFVSGRMVFATLSILPVGLFIFYWRARMVALPDLSTLGVFLVSTAMTAMLQFLISFTLALLAFWLLEVSTIIFIVFAFEFIAGGHLFPLNILPPALSKVLSYTPFPYQLFFPVSIYLGQTRGADLWRGLALQAAWVAVFYILARLVWSRGIRKYAAVGG
jgi:ABC-2 type transport system permease protein